MARFASQSLRSRPGPAAVADRVHSAAIHLLRGLRKEDEAAGLSAARLSALSVVVFAGPVTIGQLAAAEQVSAPTMTRLVVGLERDGLAGREGDAEDRRVVWIHPTAKGSRVLREARRRRVAALAGRLAGLPAPDLDLLGRAADLLEVIASGHFDAGRSVGGTAPDPGRSGREPPRRSASSRASTEE
jgi:DNA-binding MarR family transcriptional regulator